MLGLDIISINATFHLILRTLIEIKKKSFATYALGEGRKSKT